MRIPVSDFLKAILVDDWEHITKNLLLVVLPAKKTANTIIADYYDYERPRRPDGSADSDLLEEFCEGLRDYFGKTLGRILLYKFERQQYSELIKTWQHDEKGRNAGDVYGGEHLLRLLGEFQLLPANVPTYLPTNQPTLFPSLVRCCLFTTSSAVLPIPL